MKKKLITIVVPIYNEEGNILPFFNDLDRFFPKKYNKELIFIDDGSSDASLAKIKSLTRKYRFIHYISFTRNFGHQYALKAGLDYAKGDAVISMDGDFQHPPHLIPKLIESWEKDNCKIIYAQRKYSKRMPILKRLTSILFYRLINSMSESEIGVGKADFRLLDRQVVDMIKNSHESTMFLRGLVAWTGHKSKSIEYIEDKRIWGTSKYTFTNMLKLAIDAITSFSTFPLRIASIVGIFMAMTSGLYGLYVVVTWIYNREVILGWSSVILSVLFIGGIQLVILGIVGEYIGKIFLETKRRPLYLIGETNI